MQGEKDIDSPLSLIIESFTGITGITPPLIFLILAYKATKKKKQSLLLENLDDEEEEIKYNSKIIWKIGNSIILAIISVIFQDILSY